MLLYLTIVTFYNCLQRLIIWTYHYLFILLMMAIWDVPNLELLKKCDYEHFLYVSSTEHVEGLLYCWTDTFPTLVSGDFPVLWFLYFKELFCLYLACLNICRWRDSILIQVPQLPEPQLFHQSAQLSNINILLFPLHQLRNWESGREITLLSVLSTVFPGK